MMQTPDVERILGECFDTRPPRPPTWALVLILAAMMVACAVFAARCF